MPAIHSELLTPPLLEPERWLSKLADRFSYDLLEEEGLPADFLNAALAVLSRSELFAIKGAWKFLKVLQDDFHRLTPEQLELLVQAIVINYGAYRDETLCLATSDFIARICSTAVAVRAFEAMTKTTVPEGKYAVRVALEALAHEVERRGEPSSAVARAIYEQLSAG
jgi:hypothetical protein